MGLERGYHGHVAGVRTHALVAIASAMLMMLTSFDGDWMRHPAGSTVVLDATRMAHGLMTGIGFLGAGVIMKDGFTVNGLTTAASIWATAALGILIGVGHYFGAGASLAALMLTLTVVAWAEERLPMLHRVGIVVGSRRGAPIPESRIRALASVHRVALADLGYRLCDADETLESRMTIKFRNAARLKAFSDEFVRMAEGTALKVSSLGD